VLRLSFVFGSCKMDHGSAEDRASHARKPLIPGKRISELRKSIKVNVVVLIHEKHVRCEVFTAVTMKTVVFWNIKTHFVLHRRHITSPLQSPAS
jgi:hypothetical protein